MYDDRKIKELAEKIFTFIGTRTTLAEEKAEIESLLETALREATTEFWKCSEHGEGSLFWCHRCCLEEKRKAVLAERERCAKIVEAHFDRSTSPEFVFHSNACKGIAQAIRQPTEGK